MIKLRIKTLQKRIIKPRPNIVAENFKIKYYIYFEYLTSTLNTKYEPLTILGNKNIKS